MLGTKKFYTIALTVTLLLSATTSYAQIKDNADINRTTPSIPQLPPTGPNMQELLAPTVKSKETITTAPEEAKKVKFVLRGIRLRGISTYDQDDIRPLYVGMVGQEITLDALWTVAQKITDLYHNDGYFLSRAYVPAQEICDNGIATIDVVEGYIKEATIAPEMAQHRVIRQLLKDITQKVPVSILHLEREQLLLNDATGLDYQSVLEPVQKQKENAENAQQPISCVGSYSLKSGQRGAMVPPDSLVANKPLKENAPLLTNKPNVPPATAAVVAGTVPGPSPEDGAVKMNLKPRGEAPHGFTLSTDNFGSRYLGPYRVTGQWIGRPLNKLQETTISGTVSLPMKDLQQAGVQHSIPLTPELAMKLSAGYTTAAPGFDLTSQDVKSKAISAGVDFTYQLIRQRRENFYLKAGFDGRDSRTDILSTPLSRDKVRTMNIGASWNKVDGYSGYNDLNFTLTHGTNILGGSSEGDTFLSRTGATPDFLKAYLSYTRLQRINEKWNGRVSLAGQKSSSSLFSSEEFGFGGQDFGRAYDNSEISGDEGVAAAFELRYMGMKPMHQIQLYPYAFYDIGTVYNHNFDQRNKLSAASAGTGVSFQVRDNITGMLQVAMPLTKSVDTPLYGANGKNPRYSFQLSTGF